MGIEGPSKPSETVAAANTPDSSVEKPSAKKFEDFIVEKTERGGREIWYADSSELEQAIVTGTLSEEEICKNFLGGNVAAQKPVKELIAELEKLLSAPGHDDFMRDLFNRELKKFRAMQTARKEYVPVHDNTDVEINADGEQVAHDLWELIEKNSGTASSHVTGELLTKNDFFEHFQAKTTIELEISLDYPTLNHYIQIRPHEGGFGILVSGSGGKDTENKVGAPMDVLSLLRLCNYFKSKGYAASYYVSSSFKTDADTPDQKEKMVRTK